MRRNTCWPGRDLPPAGYFLPFAQPLIHQEDMFHEHHQQLFLFWVVLGNRSSDIILSPIPFFFSFGKRRKRRDCGKTLCPWWNTLRPDKERETDVGPRAFHQACPQTSALHGRESRCRGLWTWSGWASADACYQPDEEVYNQLIIGIAQTIPR